MFGILDLRILDIICYLTIVIWNFEKFAKKSKFLKSNIIN